MATLIDTGDSMGTPGFEAIVLAGGLGTRISSVVADRPKVMAQVGGRPFVEFLLGRMARQGLTRVILATGHLHALLEAHFGERWGGLEICYSREDRPLGTGGAVWKALEMAVADDVFVLNGDTFFDIDLLALFRCHRTLAADATLALKPMRNFERYGAVDLKAGRIIRFREKRKTDQGLINGGVYLIDRGLPAQFPMAGRFSLESDFFEQKVEEITIGGFVSDGYFIDIGLPEDLARAQLELPHLP
jgi:D-glycero-alpha-D-manno-heptose 1-phosphate guanylyltransferase